MSDIVITSAVRTAGGGFGGAFKRVSAVELGALIVQEAVRRSGIEPKQVDEVVFGTGWQAGLGPNIGRLVTVKGGLPHEVPAFTVNKRCGSSLRAVSLAVQMIKAGDAEVVLAGGAENTSQIPYIAVGARWGNRMGDSKLADLMHMDGFMCPLAGHLMGVTAETLVEKYNISREEQDAFAAESQTKAVNAVKEGKFKEEILPVDVPVKKGQTETFDTEEIPREGVSAEKLAKLKPVFKKDGTVTAGNSCALCDAAAAVLVMKEEKASELGVKPLARIVSYAHAGVDPAVMGIGPVPAVSKALERAGLELKDIDIIELNEAFAAQILAVERELKWDRSKVNVHGGAIALGHPVGATGAKILTTLIYALQSQDKNMGLVSLCIGGGQGVAIVIERLA
ncbi:MAG: acetyl-CoA C-acetyltransferase [Candidatus Aminicenantes bacterium]|nr:acetyl-CoA C-acetyltransferase [Candidatus Aminicenantes bacterium]MBL7082786.1 acetyl-CoA C-acetyltransferase [Candidatus Aminicenantes bacterium]